MNSHLANKYVIRPEIRTVIGKYILDRYSGPIILPIGIIKKIPDLLVYLGLKYQLGYNYIY